MTPASRITDMIDFLGSRYHAIRQRVMERLLAQGPAAVPYLVPALAADAWLVRRGAILALERILTQYPHRAHEVLPAIRNCLRDMEADVREAAIRIVGRFRDRHSLEGLHHELRTGRLDLLPAVVEALGRIGDPSSAPALCTLLESLEFPRSREPVIVWALGQIGAPIAIPVLCRYGAKQRGLPDTLLEEARVQMGGGAIPELIVQLGSAGPERGPAAGALFLHGVTAFAALGRAAESASPDARARCRAILAAQGRCDLSWIEDLTSVIDHGPHRLRMLAAEGLAALADRRKHPALRSALPWLHRASAFWKGNPVQVQHALLRAITRIDAVTREIGQLPMPVGTGDNQPDQLPRPAAGSGIEGPLPLPIGHQSPFHGR